MRSTGLSFILLIISGGLLYSQSTVAPALVTWGGGSAVISSGQVDWSLGQVAIGTVSSGADQITQGFHQPEFTLVGTEDLAGYDLLLYPNPTNGQLYIKAEGIYTINRYEILDMQGHVVDGEEVSAWNTILISVELLPPGYYSLRLVVDGEVMNAVFVKH